MNILDIDAFNKATQKGDTFVNKYRQGKWEPGQRKVTILRDVPNEDAFVIEDPDGNVTQVATTTLIRKFRRDTAE